MEIKKILLGIGVFTLIAKIANANMYYRKGKYETKYTTVHFDSVDDIYRLGENLAEGFVDFYKSTKENPSLITKRLDGAVEKIANALGINDISKFKVDIVIVRNLNEIASLRRIYDSEVVTTMHTNAFYVTRKNVIYMPLDTSIELLKHELVHALQYNYFGTTDEETARKLM